MGLHMHGRSATTKRLLYSQALGLRTWTSLWSQLSTCHRCLAQRARAALILTLQEEPQQGRQESASWQLPHTSANYFFRLLLLWPGIFKVPQSWCLPPHLRNAMMRRSARSVQLLQVRVKCAPRIPREGLRTGCLNPGYIFLSAGVH